MISAPGLIKRARLAAGLTQAELAARVGTSQPVIARLERRGANPRVSTLNRVIAATAHNLRAEIGAPRSDVDETMIAANLRLAPGERLSRFAQAYRSIAGLVQAS